MHTFKAFAAAATAAAILLAPVGVSAASASADEQVRKLDIMLMVTSLRCRFGADNFQPQYQSFSASNLPALNAAAKRLEANLVARHGVKGAYRALDKISVGMANQYGQGHPWLGCGELKAIATDLSGRQDPAALAMAAEELLGQTPRSGGRFARR